jgi:hypothetical protein
MLTIQNTTLVDVADDFDVGQVSAALNSTANATGTLTMNNVGTVDIGGDFDIGPSGGAGRAVGVGTATIGTVSNLVVGMSFVAGRTTGSNHANGSSGSGTANISDVPNFDVGFGSALMPGNFDVGDAIVAGTERANAFGNVSLTRVTLDVKRRINLGELSGGSTNSATTTDGTLSLVNSLVTLCLRPNSRAGMTRLSLAIKISPGSSSSAKSMKTRCVISPLRLSTTISREAWRGSMGVWAMSSGGRG